MTDAELTRALAIYAAATATLSVMMAGLSLAWTIYRDLQDKGRIKVEMMVGRMLAAAGAAVEGIMTPQGPELVNLSDRNRLFITITNIGRRPIHVSKVWGFQGARVGINRLGFRRQGLVFVPVHLPRSLEPGQQVTEWIDEPNDILAVRLLQVSDTTGRRWRVPRHVLRRIKRRVREPERPSADGASPAGRRESAVRAGRGLFGDAAFLG